MFKTPLAALALIAPLAAAPALAGPLKLSPANPQPAAGELAPGLGVSYVYHSVRTLQQAKQVLDRAKPGPALAGLSYLDGSETDIALTSKQAQKVIASINGYIRFDAPGTYALDVISNDGIVASIGGQQVALHDGVHGCESAGVQEVEVPQAGWYALEATYFQRKGSSCLLMDWGPSASALEPVPDAAFAHKK